MLVKELIDHAHHTPKKFAQAAARYFSETEKIFLSPALMAENQVHKLEEDSKIADILNAREIIGMALTNPQAKDDYMKFLKYLRDKHGVEYSIAVHKEATQLAKEKH